MIPNRSLFLSAGCLALVLTLVPGLLLAQADRGTITGIVTDPSGAAIAGVQITATHAETNVATRTTTGPTGNYVLSRLPIGAYSLTAQSQGFRTYQQTEIRVQVDQTARIDLTLTLGDVRETVTVTGEAPIIQTESAEVSMVVNSKEFLLLPLTLGGGLRHPMTFGQLSPGVTPGQTYDAKRISGGLAFADRVFYDGIALNRASADPFHVSVESIAEFKLISNNYSAEFARATGGVTTFSVRSGTNAVHGNAFEFNSIEKYNARNFFEPAKAPYKQNSWGGTVGGPVLLPKVYDGRNKTFFFFSLEWYHRRSPGSAGLGTVPTLQMLDGNFGEWAAAGRGVIYDPATGRRDAAGRYIRDAFPQNLIPKARWSQVSTKMAALQPPPDYLGLTRNYQLQRAQSGGSLRTEGLKIDHQIRQAHRLSSLFNLSDRPDMKGTDGLYGPLESRSQQRGTTRIVRLSYDWIISPNTLHRMTAGVSRFRNPMTALQYEKGWIGKLGLKGLAGDNMPNVIFNHDYVGYGDQASYDRYFTALSLVDTLTLTRSNHSLKIGVEIHRHRTNQYIYNAVAGRYWFNRLSTGLPGTGNSGNAFASFLLGEVYQGSAYFPALQTGHRRAYYSLWVNDDWKLTNRLTLNLGLRWEVQPPATDPNNRFSWMDPLKPNPAIGGFPGAFAFAGPGEGRSGITRVGATHWRDFSPRVGFAYRVTKDTVVRGGYGIFFADGNGAGVRSLGSDGFNTSAAFSTADSGITPAFNWDAGFPQNFRRAPMIDSTLGNGQNAGVLDWDRVALNPYNQQYNLLIERQVTGSFSLSAGYVGNLGRRLESADGWNQVNPSYLALGGLLQRNILDAAVKAAGFQEPFPGFAALWGARGTLAQALRRFPQYGEVGQALPVSGNSSYHSFQLQAEKRMSRGLFFTVAYTVSKFISDVAGVDGANAGPIDFYSRRLDRSLESADQPQILTFSYIWELPFGRGRSLLTSGLGSKILGGWSITGIQSYSSGTPIAVTATNSLPVFNPGQRPNVISRDLRGPKGPGDFDPGRGDLWLNPAAFQNPAPFTFGNAARFLNVRQPARLAESLGILRDFRFTERFNLQFRMETSNLLNRVVFGGPVTNFASASFGTIGSAGTARQIQFGLKLAF